MKKVLKELFPYLIVLIVAILVKTFIFSVVQVSGDSMDDTLANNDYMILNKVKYYFNDIKRFDIVVVKHEGRYFIKRIIGLPNEKVEYIDNVLYIDGKETKEPFLNNQKTKDFEKDIEEGEYFVLGDNRNNSLDSRILGSFARKDILGTATFTIFPFNRFGTKK